MSTNKTFNKVQLDVKFTQATSRVNLISEENISISFGKISKYFADLHSQAFTGYTHPTYTARTGKPTGNQTPGFGSTFTISQITSDGTGHVTAATDRTVKIPDTTMGAASADAAGSKGLVPAPAAGKQTSFLRGDGTWAVPTNTDTKVTQSQTTTTNYRPILFGANNSTDVSTLANTITDQAYTSTKMYAQPSTGLIFCTGRKIENVTIQTGSTKHAHITLQTLMTWLITTKTYIPSGQYCHVIISTTWAYANNDILQVSIDGTNYEIQLAGVIIEFIGDATSYNAGMFRLLIHSSPTINFTATSGYSKFPVSTIAEYTCNGSDYSPTWKKIWNSHPTYTSKSSGLYKITVDGTGHVSAATAVAKADITALGIPGSDTNTTYTIATGDSNGQIKVTPSSGSAYNVSVKGLGSAAYTSSTAYLSSSTKYAGSSSVGGAATSANKLNTDAGSSTLPVYFTGGIPSPVNNVTSGAYYAAVPAITGDGVMEIGKYIDFHEKTSTNDFDCRLTSTTTGLIAEAVGAFNTLTIKSPGSTQLSFQTTSSGKAYTASGVTCYPLGTTGMTALFNFGGNVVIGGGEAAKTLYDNDYDTIKTVERETLYLASDSAELHLITDAQTYANRKVLRIIGGQLTKSGGAWIAARDHAPVYSYKGGDGTSGSFYPAIFSKSKTGGWAIGTIGNDDSLYASYTTDANYSSDTNTSTYTIQFPKDSGTLALTSSNITGTSANVTGTVAIAHGGTGATTRLAALRALTEQNVGTSAQYFLTITDSWGKGGYTSVANAKTVLGMGSAAYTSSTAYLSSSTKYAGSSSAGGPALSVSTAGGDVVLGTNGSSSDDSGDIVWNYGNGKEKARLWQDNTYTAKAGPQYRIYKSDGTGLYSGRLPLADGTSASGTWGISITGSAASATILQTARNINGVSFDGSANITIPRSIKCIHTASGKEGTAGWVKIARITVTSTYANHPMTFTIAQRGVTQYRIHLVFVNNGSVAAAAISQFIIARDNSWTDTNNNPRAYIIKPSDGIFDLYIRKTEAYDHIFVVDFTKADNSEGDNYSVAWTNVHAADSAITGGTEATKKTYSTTDHTHNYAGSSSVGGPANSATRADYVNVVASNEIRFYNDNQLKANNHLWIGYSWAAGSHYTPSGGSDTSSMTAPNITEFVMGNCSAGGLASVHAKTFILGNGSSPTKSSKTTTITTAATITDRTITLPDASGTVALLTKGSTSYWGMIDGDGATSGWIRTTTNGLIAQTAVSLANGGDGALGTSSWAFKEAYIAKVHALKYYGWYGQKTNDTRQSTANLTCAGKGAMQLIIVSSTLTTGRPGADGYIMDYDWDNTGPYKAQLFIPNSAAYNSSLQWRSQTGSSDWSAAACAWRNVLDANNLEYMATHSTEFKRSFDLDVPMSPILRSTSFYNRANRFALIEAGKIVIQYSSNNGSTWTDMAWDTTDNTTYNKSILFNDTINASVPIGPRDSSDRTTSMKTRIIVTVDDRDVMVDQFLLQLNSAYQKITVTLEASKVGSVDTFETLSSLTIDQWDYQCCINTKGIRFNTSSGNYAKLRITLGYSTIDSKHKTSVSTVLGIAAYSGIYWGTNLLVNGSIGKSDIALYDRPYAWMNDGTMLIPTQLKIFNGNYGTFIRSDGANTYFLLTNSGPAQTGLWNSLRPLYFSNSTGFVTMENGASISSSAYGALSIKRTSANNAGIKFYNNGSTYLGSLAIDAVNGTFHRFKTDDSTMYEIIDRSVVRNNTTVGTLGWTSSSADTVIPTVNTIAYWNGAYSGTSSNLAYCKKGEFGTIVTKSTTDYSKVSISRNLTSGTKVGTITIDGTATDLYCQTNSDTKVTQNIASGSANLPLLMSYYQTDTAVTAAQVVYRNNSIYANPSAGTITANKFYGDITGYGLDAGIYDLLNVDDPTFNGTEWMLTSIPSSSGGTSTPAFRRVKTAKFADYVSSTSRKVLFDQSDNTSTSISLSTPPTDTQYLKLYFKSSGNSGRPTVDNSVYSIAEVPYMTGVKLGGILQVAQSSDNQGILRLTALAFTVDITIGNPYTLRLIKVSKASRISGSGVSDDSVLSANIIKVVAYR